MLIHHQSTVISYKIPFLLKPTSLSYLQLSPLVLSSFGSHAQPCKPQADRLQLGQAVSKTLILEPEQLPEQPRSKNHFILWKRNKWERSVKGTSTAKVMQSQGKGDLMCLRCLTGWRNKQLLRLFAEQGMTEQRAQMHQVAICGGFRRYRSTDHCSSAKGMEQTDRSSNILDQLL